MKSEAKPNIMNIINDYAGERRHLITLGRILAAVSALMGLVPFYLLWKIIRIAVNGEDLTQIPGFEKQTVLNLNKIRSEGALAAYQSCL